MLYLLLMGEPEMLEPQSPVNGLLNIIVTTVLPPLVTAILGWLFGFKMNKARTKGSELENTEKAAKIWRELSQSLYGDMAKMREEMQKEREQCRREFTELRQSLDLVMGFINSDTALQKRFKEYIANHEKV